MLHPPDLRRTLRAGLDPAPTPLLADRDRLAAVVAPVVEAPEPAVIFTVRASGLSRHAGEVSFPGGLQDPGETLVETALREAFEEVGLRGSDVEILGALPSVHTFVSDILVVPFVGILRTLPPLTVSDGEIQQLLVLPVAHLAEVEAQVEYPRADGRVWRGWAYEADGHTIWGATGWMLHELLDLIRKETSWLTA
jgi:8-oxo-dGTP pyrophosphatase MutT (NUDIX family)